MSNPITPKYLKGKLKNVYSTAAMKAAKRPPGPTSSRVAAGLLPKNFPGEDRPLTMKQARQGAKAMVGTASRDSNNNNEPVFGPNMSPIRGNRGRQQWSGNAIKGR